jgi:hypothetical protein
MNREYKPVNNSYREHFKIYGYLSPKMIEELLDKVDSLDNHVEVVEQLLVEAEESVDYWKSRV